MGEVREERKPRVETKGRKKGGKEERVECSANRKCSTCSIASSKSICKWKRENEKKRDTDWEEEVYIEEEEEEEEEIKEVY